MVHISHDPGRELASPMRCVDPVAKSRMLASEMAQYLKMRRLTGVRLLFVQHLHLTRKIPWKMSPENVDLPYRSLHTSRSRMASPKKKIDDFVWQWRLKRIEGDVDKFMADAGTNWALRKMAKQMNYGIR